MSTSLKTLAEDNLQNDWMKTGQNDLNEEMRGDLDEKALAQKIISYLSTYLGAQIGTIYQTEEQEKTLKLMGSYAFTKRTSVNASIEFGEGLVGQAAFEKKMISVTNLPKDYTRVSSSIGDSMPRNVIVSPILFEGELNGVVELASIEEFSDVKMELLNSVMETIAININSTRARSKMKVLLEETQTQSEELISQQKELKNTNEKLEAQAKNLKASESKLKTQQEELQQTNEELEEKSKVLADQKEEVEQKNIQVEEAKSALEEKAQQLAVSSKYKSEFLANMSHELRTPLNSLMVLSDGLRKNMDKNLTTKQIEKMNTIHDSGIELLELINEILDLAKIEAGKMSIQVGDIFFERLQGWSERGFSQMAENKGLKYSAVVDESLPKAIQTDEKRLQQVIKNFLSNAIKFTEKGSVTFNMRNAQSGWSDNVVSLNEASVVVAFSVIDTGIGIETDKQGIIFEAFQQADGTTSRKYGGTGLGLSISREIAAMLGGEIVVESEPGKGSTFTLFLPLVYLVPNVDDNDDGSSPTQGAPHKGSLLTPTLPRSDKAKGATKAGANTTTTAAQNITGSLVNEAANEVEDDRVGIKPGDKSVLIIEDDISFANILLDTAREQGFKGIVATTGDTGLACAQEFKPDAIILDIKLPIMNGWTVLDRIKHDPAIRHTPVQIVSVDDVGQRCLKQGAIACLQKPLNDNQLTGMFAKIEAFQKLKYKQLLVVEDDDNQRKAIIDLIGNGDVQVTAVSSAKAALKALKDREFNCMVLDLMLPDMNGFELIEAIKEIPELISLPIIVYTGKELSTEEETRLRSTAETIIIKDVRSPERLLDETALFLHRIESNLPESKREMLQQVHESDPQLAGRKILIVDDDTRNIFTLTSVFEAHESITMFAESGKQAIATLKKNPDIEIILMDIMMPEMDGYQTMQAIRKIKRFKDLPIIAVTAKAMKEDRKKCLDAGASDYIVKPIDTEQLLSLVRVWLYK
jgi:CheY-like chemotaxis protein/putative methionine-R-sulfoxide reductase with GAF domain